MQLSRRGVMHRDQSSTIAPLRTPRTRVEQGNQSLSLASCRFGSAASVARAHEVLRCAVVNKLHARNKNVHGQRLDLVEVLSCFHVIQGLSPLSSSKASNVITRDLYRTAAADCQNLTSGDRRRTIGLHKRNQSRPRCRDVGTWWAQTTE